MSAWKTLSSKIAYKNPWFAIREDKIIDPSGKDGLYCVLEKAPSVFIVPLTKTHETFLIQVSRYTTAETTWEIPAGGVEQYESATDAAKRELFEELGLTTIKTEIAGTFQCINSISNQRGTTVIAYDCDYRAMKPQEKEGIQRIKKASLKTVLSMIEAGEIVDGQSITAFTQAALKLKLYE